MGDSHQKVVLCLLDTGFIQILLHDLPVLHRSPYELKNYALLLILLV
jgi:hypothetical protein